MHSKKNDWFFLFVASVIGFIFFKSAYGKLTGGEFVDGLAGTLKFFASENPHSFVKTFLTDTIIPNSILFGHFTMWGEFLSAVCILVPVVYYLFTRKRTKHMMFLLGIGFLVGAFLNWTFWFAAGWTSPSTHSLNLLMGLIQSAGVVYVVKDYRNIK
ncbi:MAG TPA: hypothetical protein PLD54_04405 [Candidatus Levybacteria bacterium]|nr:hypothetical protein [Candidatus Levybacteria bacterium]